MCRDHSGNSEMVTILVQYSRSNRIKAIWKSRERSTPTFRTMSPPFNERTCTSIAETPDPLLESRVVEIIIVARRVNGLKNNQTVYQSRRLILALFRYYGRCSCCRSRSMKDEMVREWNNDFSKNIDCQRNRWLLETIYFTFTPIDIS